jgi:hypothetical protein
MFISPYFSVDLKGVGDIVLPSPLFREWSGEFHLLPEKGETKRTTIFKRIPTVVGVRQLLT